MYAESNRQRNQTDKDKEGGRHKQETKEKTWGKYQKNKIRIICIFM